MMELFEYLKGNTYPGRGILIGKGGEDGNTTVTAYFIMGRSINSRNRIFEATSDGIRTKAFDESKCVDPSLIIYSPVRRFENKLIVTNGDQTDTIHEALSRGGSFESALMTREFEPDAPNFTPRISGISDENGYELSILKTVPGENRGKKSIRCFYCYDFERGIAHIIHTYEHDGEPIPTFEGEPRRFTLPELPIDDFALGLWNSLDKENRVSLFVRYTENGRENTKIINKQN